MPRFAGWRGSVSAPQSCEKRPEREHRREERAFVDTEGGGEQAMLGCSAHEHPEAGALHEPRQPDEHERAHDEQEQVVLGHRLPEPRDHTVEPRYAGPEPVLGTP
jgi:hypothetical protein